MTLRVAVIGASGRMGSATCAAVEADDRCELAVGIDSSDSLEAVLDAGADVAVEFTTPASVFANTSWLLEHGVHVVVGASGLTDDQLADLERKTGPANCMVIPNFSIGAVLMMRFAAEAAGYLPDVEIIEAHHPQKVDAPSGTALRTAAMIAEARQTDPDVPGPKGHEARGHISAQVPIHSVRLPGIVASQEVVFGGPGQTLAIRHDSVDRSSFMPGVLLAVTRVGETPALTVGLDRLLQRG